MRLRPFILSALLILNAFAQQAAAEIYDPISKEIKSGTITIIGESQKKIESVQLFQGLVTDYLKQGQCLTVGLEIASNQQTVIDRIMQGRATAADIEIPPMIDHPPFRKMIDDLADLKRNGACLKLVAIDAGDDIDMGRDEWMALKLAELGNNETILVLLGALHSLKKVDWDLSMVADPSLMFRRFLYRRAILLIPIPNVGRKVIVTETRTNTEAGIFRLEIRRPCYC